MGIGPSGATVPRVSPTGVRLPGAQVPRDTRRGVPAP